MRVPDDFAALLQREFNGRFRLRWSDKRREFHLEQKVYTGQIMEPPMDDSGRWDTFSDEHQRAVDGYMLTMVIRDGDRMPCPVCGATVRVPIMETREAHCDNCKNHGLDGKYKASFYPLNHTLIEHLHDIDPYNGGPQRVRQRMRDKEEKRQARLSKASVDEGQERFLDDKIQAMQTPMVGYGPKGAPARIY